MSGECRETGNLSARLADANPSVCSYFGQQCFCLNIFFFTTSGTGMGKSRSGLMSDAICLFAGEPILSMSAVDHTQEVLTYILCLQCL